MKHYRLFLCIASAALLASCGQTKNDKPLPLLVDTCSMEEKVTILTSDDGNLRLYGWDNGEGGTMIAWSNITQYRTSRGTESVNHHIDNLEGKEDTFESVATALYTIPCDNGRTLYLVQNYFREWSSMAYSHFSAYTIQDNKLHPEEIFATPQGKERFIGIEYDLCHWYDVNGSWDHFMDYDTATRTIYLPRVIDTTADNQFSLADRYDRYQFDGCQFVYRGESAGYWLHPSLHNYLRLAQMARTKQHLVRIDETAPGIFRYASWPAGGDQLQEPDIVIEGGRYIDAPSGRCYEFLNQGHRYRLYYDRLEVARDNKVILNAPLTEEIYLMQ